MSITGFPIDFFEDQLDPRPREDSRIERRNLAAQICEWVRGLGLAPDKCVEICERIEASSLSTLRKIAESDTMDAMEKLCQ